MLYAGVDIGSRTIKVVVIDESAGAIVASGLRDQGVKQDRKSTRLNSSH